MSEIIPEPKSTVSVHLLASSGIVHKSKINKLIIHHNFLMVAMGASELLRSSCSVRTSRSFTVPFSPARRTALTSPRQEHRSVRCDAGESASPVRTWASHLVESS